MPGSSSVLLEDCSDSSVIGMGHQTCGSIRHGEEDEKCGVGENCFGSIEGGNSFISPL